jgi:Ethanolamine utilization protein EutJ (predicted chaperonin)
MDKATIEEIKSRITEIRDKNDSRIDEYAEAGGEESFYLVGKAAAYDDVLVLLRELLVDLLIETPDA